MPNHIGPSSLLGSAGRCRFDGSDGDSWIEQIYRGDLQAVSVVLAGFAIPLPDLWPEIEEEQNESERANGVS
jgi:hypothetical protein